VHDLVEAQAQENPGALAVVQEGRQLSYQELNVRSNQLARLLRQKAWAATFRWHLPEAVAGTPVALLAILKAGGAWCAARSGLSQGSLGPHFRRLARAVLITQRGQHSALGDVQADVLYLDADWKILSGQGRENLPRSPSRTISLHYLHFGSTGKPRGVLLTHRGLVNHGVASIDLYGIERSDRVLQFSSIGFDIAVEEIFPTWFAGATVVLRSDQNVAGRHGFPALDQATANHSTRSAYGLLA